MHWNLWSLIFKRQRNRKVDALRPLLFRTSTAESTERVDVRDQAALEAWSANLNVSPEHLIRAVIVVGDKVPDVQHYLKVVAE
jgi:hypothetical protein